MTTTALPSLVVDQVAIDDLRPDPSNPRRIGEDELDALERSLRQFGFVQPVLARREDRTVIGGHQRLVAARRLGLATVPVTWLDVSVEQARLLGLALNKISGSWDEQLLARLLADLGSTPELDLSLSGFDEDEVKDLLRSLETREKRERPESFDLEAALDEARRAPRTKRGELWRLGDHRLLCGDATDPTTSPGCSTARPPPCWQPTRPTACRSTRPGATACTTPWVPPRSPTCDGCQRGDDATRANGGAHGRSRGHRNTRSRVTPGSTGPRPSRWCPRSRSATCGTPGSMPPRWPRASPGSASRSCRRSSGTRVCSRSAAPGTTGATSPAGSSRKAGAKAPFRGTRDQATIWRVPSPKMIMGGSTEAK